ncbi:MAG TPA: LacI family DNA-binding transcriptional regulator [Anaerolineae bacterium]|nr:LacI family DNA-binding transcriptional regulator [Anaerolineae bacterium]HPL26914.1 LacI family DNA-binding transcriptional regulator [Anaerolineae bacterium]
MPTVAEIARLAGVSKSTVSLVMNNRPHVSEAMRRRVLQALDELRRTSGLAEVVHQPAKILLIHPATLYSSSVFRELLQGAQAGVEEAGARLTLAVCQTPLTPDHTTHVLLHDRRLRPDGVIVMDARLDDPILDEVRRESLPCALLARQQGPPDMCAVGWDNQSGMCEATRYLIDLGHRHIAFLGGDLDYDYTELRIAGYRAALKEAGIDQESIFLGTGEQAASAFLASGADAAAVVCVNDEHALKALPILRQAGLRVRDDISVVGFDDSDEAASCDPPLTSVAVPRVQVGYWTARAVLECVRNRDIAAMHIVLRPRLRVRASCLAPAGQRAG